MRLPEICIRRPVLTSMMSLGLILVGIVSITRLPVRELPEIDTPIVNVTTVYPGANAEVVETEVTEKLEEAISSVDGIRTLSSESREEVSNVTVEFTLARDIDIAAQDIRDQVARVRGELPEDIEDPVVAKQEADARPIMWIALFSEQYSTLEITTIAENYIKDRLQTINGVSSVILGGRKRYAIRISLDSQKMAARQITVVDVQRALQEQNVELPSGRVENRLRELTIETLGELKTPEEFNRLVLRQDEGGIVRLRDVGLARSGVEDERTIARFNSKPSMGLGIVRQSKANTIQVARDIKAEMARIAPSLPDGIQISYPYDESVFIEKSIRDVYLALGLAFFLVVFTIFLFLHNVRSTFIPAITIPISIIGTFAIFYAFGFSINIVTLLALVLAIGLVVDDSIVVLENIYRHVEAGMKPRDAAFKGMKEIAFAVIATTLALIAVFLPMTFQTTVTGRLFIEFALSLSGAVIISTFIALSLSPMLCARILRPETEPRGIFALFDRLLNRVSQGYAKALDWALHHRLTVLTVSATTLAAAAFFFSQLEDEFLPSEDKGRLLNIALAPEGSTSEYTLSQLEQMENIIASYPEAKEYFSAVALPIAGRGNPIQAFLFVRMHEQRERSLQDMVDGPVGIGARFFTEVEGAFAFPIIPKAIDTGFGQPFQLVLQHPDLKTLNEMAEKVTGELRQGGFLANVRSNFQLNKPALRLSIARERATDLGVSIQDIARTLQILFGGLDLSTIKRDGKEYQVIVQLDRESRLTPTDIDKLYVRNREGDLIQLNNLVYRDTGAGPNAIQRYNRLRAAVIEGTPQGVTLGTAIDRTRAVLDGALTEDFRYQWSGEARDLLESSQDTLFVILLAALVIYMVLAAQFESLIHPFTAMLSVPLAAAGALGAIWFLGVVDGVGNAFYGWVNYAPDAPSWAHWVDRFIPRIPAMNLNFFTKLGLILLMGLVTKNGILIVEFANQLVAQGKSALEASFEAGKIRLRPILMTTVATIAGMAPIAIGLGAGAESRRPLAVAAMGGMAVSTFFTLFVIPIVYYLFARAKEKRQERTNSQHSSPS